MTVYVDNFLQMKFQENVICAMRPVLINYLDS